MPERARGREAREGAGPRPSILPTAAGAFALDAALVVAFAATGRASHDSDVLGGLVVTAWPFLVGLALGWLTTRAWRDPGAPLRAGLGVWAGALVGGMLLRAVSGQGTALPFVIVAAATLALLLIGWRALGRAIARASRRSSSRV